MVANLAPSTPASSPSILIIEDSKSVRELISVLLRAGGFDVSGSGTLADAIVCLQSRVPDMIVLDEQLPDGLASKNLHRIRAHAPNTPLVFVSGHLDLAIALDLSQSGVSAIFNKPINPKAFIAKLRELHAALPARPSPSAIPTAPDATPAPPKPSFRWTGFPGSCPSHQHLGAQLLKVCDFRSTLLLLGNPGFAFWPITRDLHANSALRSSPLLALAPSVFSRANLSAQLALHLSFSETLTLALDRIETYDAAQALLLDELINFRGAFAAYTARVRTVLSAPLSFLDETSVPSPLSPDLVQRIAALTVSVPAFSTLRENRVHLARSLLAEIGSESIEITDDTVRWFESRPWPGDYHQFRRVILITAANASGSLTPEVLESAFNLESTLPPDAYAPICVDPSPSLEPPLDKAPPPPSPIIDPAASEPLPDGLDRYLATSAATPSPSAPAQPPSTPKNTKSSRVGSYDFSSRLNASLDAPATPPPVSPVHPRFAPKPGSTPAP